MKVNNVSVCTPTGCLTLETSEIISPGIIEIESFEIRIPKSKIENPNSVPLYHDS